MKLSSRIFCVNACWRCEAALRAGSPRPFFGPPADGGTGPSPADGPGFALPKDQAAGPREDR